MIGYRSTRRLKECHDEGCRCLARGGFARHLVSCEPYEDTDRRPAPRATREDRGLQPTLKRTPEDMKATLRKIRAARGAIPYYKAGR